MYSSKCACHNTTGEEKKKVNGIYISKVEKDPDGKERRVWERGRRGEERDAHVNNTYQFCYCRRKG